MILTKDNLISIIITTLIVFQLSARAADEAIANGMADKGTHGFVNIITCWIELPMQIYKGYDRSVYMIEGHPALSRSLGTIKGVFRGVGFTAGRLYQGAYELLGFWSANPKDNHGIGIPFDDEYAMDMGLTHDIPLTAIHRPIYYKLKRGVRNIAGVIIDFPIPYFRKIYDPPVSYGTELWFVPSKLWVGLYETTGCLLPNTLETEGYSFDLTEIEDF